MDSDQIRETVERAAAQVNAAEEELSAARSQLRRALERRAALPGRQPWVCGTPAGYRRHQRNDETPCYACTAGMTIQRQRGL